VDNITRKLLNDAGFNDESIKSTLQKKRSKLHNASMGDLRALNRLSNKPILSGDDKVKLRALRDKIS
jgi:hypothetical protein